MQKKQVPKEVKERIDQVQQFTLAREDLRKQNIECQTEYEEVNLTKRTLNLNKIQKFINRLKICEEQSRPQLLKDLETFNLSKYMSETANAIAGCAITKHDIKFFMELISKIHQDYQEFAEIIGATLVKNILSGGGLQEPEKQAIRRKNLLRLLGELVAVGIPVEDNTLFNGVRGAMLNKDYDKQFTEQNIISGLEFAQAFFKVFFGEQSSKIMEYCQEYGLYLAKQEILLPMNEIKRLDMWWNQIYMAKLQDILKEKYELIIAQETKNQKYQREGGTLREEDIEAIKTLTADYDGFKEQIQNIIDELNLEVELEENKAKELVQQTLQMEEDAKKLEIQKMYEEKQVKIDYVFKTEKEQQLYETFPDLKAIVPEILLTPQTKEEEAKEEENYTPYNEEEDKEDEKEEEEKQGIEDFVMSSYKQCIKKLEDCDSIKKSDDLASEFCYINSYTNRRRLVEDVLNRYQQKNYKKYLPYRVRTLVILAQQFPLLKEHAEKYILDKFKRYRDSENYVFDNQKNILVLCELCKFQMIPLATLLNCMKVYIDTLNAVKLDYITDMIENCGHYLLLIKESKMRFQMMMSFLQKKKDDQEIFDEIRKVRLKMVLEGLKNKK